MYSVTKRIDFCYGHRLLDYDGICKHPHGHNAVAEISVRSGELDSRCMVCDFSDIKRMSVLVPPRDEQAAIVRFLDHADRRIRRYIRGKQKQIKLLEEQKQAIIHCAMTRGLNSNVRLRPSGVEWLGEVYFVNGDPRDYTRGPWPSSVAGVVFELRRTEG